MEQTRFLLHVFGFTAFTGLQQVSERGVVLLLFTIGLKFDLHSLLQPEAHGTAALHLITAVLLGAGTIGAAAAIGITIAGEEPPSRWAFALVLIVPMVWVLRRLLGRVGRGELLALFGVVMASGPGYVAFESVGIHGDLGLGMIGSSSANAYSLQIVAKLDAILPDENESRLRANDRPLDTGDAEVVVLGKGRRFASVGKITAARPPIGFATGGVHPLRLAAVVPAP